MLLGILYQILDILEPLMTYQIVSKGVTATSVDISIFRGNESRCRTKPRSSPASAFPPHPAWGKSYIQISLLALSALPNKLDSLPVEVKHLLDLLVSRRHDVLDDRHEQGRLNSKIRTPPCKEARGHGRLRARYKSVAKRSVLWIYTHI